MNKYLFFLLILIFSCSAVKHSSTGLKIKGTSKTYKYFDKNLNGRAVVQGFVYSRMDSTSSTNATITIDFQKKIGAISNENGFFSTELDPGTYEIECFSLGHTPQSKKLNIKENERIVILFELGTDLIY